MIGGENEFILRLATHRRMELEQLSDEAFRELVLDVESSPRKFLQHEDDRAFLELSRAIDTFFEGIVDEYEDEQGYLLHDTPAFHTLQQRTGELTERSTLPEAALVEILAGKYTQDERIAKLVALDKELDMRANTKNIVTTATAQTQGSATEQAEASVDLWDDVFSRGRLRVKAALARIYLTTTRFSLALEKSRELIALSPQDELGAHKTAALALARLEDEAGLNELEATCASGKDPWLHLARIILLYKLDRMSAATRALRGYNELFKGGAYVLLRPYFVDLYLPDRPSFAPGSFNELKLAVSEAYPILADVPDLVGWAESQTWFFDSAERFANEHDLDW